MQYKDREPNETVRIIKDLLLKHNIITTEKWVEGAKNLYSVMIQVEGTHFCVNGKGTSKPYALASAYGELMERLQNLAFFYINTDILYYDKKNLDLFESLVEKEQLKEIIEKWAILCELNDIKTLLYDVSLEICCDRANEKIRCERFIEFGGIDEFVLPYKISAYYYGTNGMVAGNSKEEALVQGLSEIIERYVTRIVIEEKLTPPRISQQDLVRYEKINSYIETIESTKRYKIEMVDLSLGRKIPAVGLILYDKIDLSYFVKIASCPSIQIAFERCFTELLQGKTIEKFGGKTSFVQDNSLLSNTHNIRSIFESGIGVYPDEFFMSEESYQSSLQNINYKSQKEMLDALIEIIRDLGYKIYFRDTSKSQIFSYHIIVPGMSEVSSLRDFESVKNFKKYEYICDVIKNQIQDITEEQVITIRDYLEHVYYPENTSIAVFYKYVSFDDGVLVNKIKLELFKVMVYLYLKDYEKAIQNLSQYIKTIRDKESVPYKYYSCMVKYLKLILKSNERSAIYSILSKYFSPNIIEKVTIDLETNPFKNLSSLFNCARCDTCSFELNCLRKYECELYNIVKNKWCNM